MRRIRPASVRLFAAFLLAGLLASCSNDTGIQDADAAPSTDVQRIPVTVEADGNTLTFSSEVADTTAERQKGLMHRTSMGDREGMLFLFPREQQLSFWMRNTLIPLDMIFIRTDRTILGIVENATPRTDTPRRVPGNSQFVLEINGGLSRKLGIRAGQKVQFYAPIPNE